MNNNNLIHKAITNIGRGDFLTKGQQQANADARSKAMSYGINLTGSYSYERRALSYSQNQQHLEGTDVAHIFKSKGQDILSQVTYVKNCKNALKYPFVDGNCAEFNNDGISIDLMNNTVNSVLLKPHRIIARVPYTKELDIQNTDFQGDLIELINQATEDTLIKAIFSTTEGTQHQPNGLFSLVPTTAINTVDDIETMANKVDSNIGANGVWMVSATAKTKLYKQYKDYINNDMLFGAPIICDGRIEQDYMCYVDLKHIVVADWTFNTLTIDNVTQAKDGLNIITTETFIDFNFVDTNYIAVGKF